MIVTLAAPFLRRYLTVATPSSRRVVSKPFPFWGRSRSRRRRTFLPSIWEDSKVFIGRPLYHTKDGKRPIHRPQNPHKSPDPTYQPFSPATSGKERWITTHNT